MSNATFSHDEVSLELPLAPATQGNNGYDITKLLAVTGDTTLDVGFANTASCRSAITFIDGDAGILRYRGYPIEQLAEKSTFLEVSYLVLHGELPTPQQLQEFQTGIAKYHLIDERMREMFRSLPRKSHPMPVLSAGAQRAVDLHRVQVRRGRLRPRPPPTCCWAPCPPLPPTATRTRSASRSSMPTTR